MTTTIWNNPVSGYWSTPVDWLGDVPNSSEDAVINAQGSYAVTIAAAVSAKSLTMDAAGATLSEAASGSLTMSGRLTLDDGTIILNGANNFGGQTRLIDGTLKLGNAAALGTSNLTIDGGTLVGAANIAFSNEIDASGSFALATGHGDTFTLAGQTVLNMNAGGTVAFGAVGDDGTFIWDPLTLGVAHGGANFSIDINAGTLRDGNGTLNKALSAAALTSVATGATLDIYGHSETIIQIIGGGVITSSVSGSALTIDVGNIASIRGSIALTVGQSLTLTGVSSYTGGTTINQGARFFLAGAGTIAGNIVDNGILEIGGRATAPSGVISGTGSIILDGGVAVLNDANTYSGGTVLNGGTLEVDNPAALGTGEISFKAGTFQATATESVSDQLAIFRSATFLAAHGTTLTLNTSAPWALNYSRSVTFGNSTSDGMIVWDTLAGSTIGKPGSITIAGGILRAGDSNFQTLLNHAANVGHTNAHTDIEAGATLDVAGFASTIYNLSGTGTIDNSGASTTITISKGVFGGDFFRTDSTRYRRQYDAERRRCKLERDQYPRSSATAVGWRVVVQCYFLARQFREIEFRRSLRVHRQCYGIRC